MGHEVLWTRAARSMLGGDARAVSAAVVATLTGLSLGALLARRLQKRWSSVGAFVRIEIVAAIFAAAMPFLANGTSALVGALYRTFGAGLPFAISSYVIATLMFLPASFALGAGLPLLASAFPAQHRFASFLYSLHAAGSALGAAAVGFWLLPAWAAPLTALTLSAVQLIVALGASRLPEMRASTRPLDATPWREWVGCVPFFVAGVASFALQALWTRIAALAVGPTVQSFALVAALYVVALSVGAVLATVIARKTTELRLAAAVSLFLGSAFVLALSSSVEGWTSRAAHVFAAMEDGRPSYVALARILLPAVGAAATCFGAAFSFAVVDVQRGEGKTDHVGTLLGVAAIGNAVGALVGPFVLVPLLGSAKAFVACAAMLALAALLLLLPRIRKASRASLAILAAAVVLHAACLPFTHFRFDLNALTAGPFLYAGPTHPTLGDISFSHEGVDALVTVRRVGDERLLQIDGKIDGSLKGDAATQTLVGLLPTLLARNPSRALVIGLGTGMTVDAVRSVPGVSRVEVAELVDGVRYAAPHFGSVGRAVLQDPRVHVLPVDGSMLLRHGAAQWDVIVSEPSNPWVAGMGDMFSEEVFRGASEHLSDGGVMATWFHVYATNLEIVREIMASFVRVFPDATLWELQRGEDYMLVGQKGGAAFDFDRIASRVGAVEVRQNLERASVSDASALFGRLVSVSEGIVRGTTDMRSISVVDGNLEARATLALYQDASQDALAFFDEIALRENELRATAQSADGRALLAAWPAALEARALSRRAVLRALRRDEAGAISLSEMALGLQPHDPSIQTLVATLYLSRGKTHALAQEVDDARDALLTVLEVNPPEENLRVDALVTLGDLDLATGNAQRALDRYQRARRMRPDSPDIADRIATALERLGAHEDAAREHALSTRLRSLQPN